MNLQVLQLQSSRAFGSHSRVWTLPLLVSLLTGGGACTALANPVPLDVTPFEEDKTAATQVAANQPGAHTSVWSDVDVADGGFKILMPGEIDRKVNLVQVNGNPVEQTLLLATQSQHDAFYMVAWSDLSDKLPVDSLGHDRILEQAKNSFLKSFKGKLTEEVNMKLSGNNGKQYVMTSYVRGNAFTITSRTYVVEQRLYHILAAVPQRVESSLQGSTLGFLKSFRLRPWEVSQADSEG